VKRELLKSKVFIRSAKKFVKKSHQIIDDIEETLELLPEDAFYPSLKTHKLKGRLEGSWACSVGYDLRIVFGLYLTGMPLEISAVDGVEQDLTDFRMNRIYSYLLSCLSFNPFNLVQNFAENYSPYHIG
jgi:addiction module RelE/StbE family toxin